MNNTKELAFDHGIPTAFAVILGAVGGIYNYHQARAAVALRPRLDNISFVTAFLAGHGADWLFLFYPVWTAAVSTLVLIVICNFLWVIYNG